jgi:hypothetical protein
MVPGSIPRQLQRKKTRVLDSNSSHSGPLAISQNCHTSQPSHALPSREEILACLAAAEA